MLTMAGSRELLESKFGFWFVTSALVNRVLFPGNATTKFFFYIDCIAKSPWWLIARELTALLPFCAEENACGGPPQSTTLETWG